MKGNINTDLGKIYYNEDVIAKISGLSTMECYGVVGMASKNATDGIWELMKGENLNKGVKVSTKEDKLFIELYIIVEYGTKISVIADNIIKTVKYNINNYTGLVVGGITVNVKGVRV